MSLPDWCGVHTRTTTTECLLQTRAPTLDVGGNSAGILFTRWIVDSFGASRQGGKALMHAEYPLAASDLDSICQVQIGASSWELILPPNVRYHVHA